MSLNKRFSELSKFNSNVTYKNLPIRFSPLDDEQFVVTNMAGEYVVISKEDLGLLVNKPNELHNSLDRKSVV